MSPHGLALRTLLLGRTRSVLAVLLVGASLCVLDLFAGHIASVRAGIEYQAVIGARLGHLSVLRARLDGGARPMFAPGEARRALRIIEANRGVALAMPQMSVSGIASSATGSALFAGEGVAPAPAALPPRLQELPGKLAPGNARGIAVSTGQADALGLRQGSSVTLTGAHPAGPAVALSADVVDVYSGGAGETGKGVVMPFGMAQSLLDTDNTERIVVFLNEPDALEQRRQELGGALRRAGIAVEVRSWQEQSDTWISERGASDLAFDSVAGMVFAVIAATIAATMSMNALERRREVATLRALGMRSSSVFLMFVAEALWMALIGVALSLVGSGLVAWVVNRASLPNVLGSTLSQPPMMVELDFDRMLMAIVTVLAVALLASLVPAFKAARAAIPAALAA